MESKTHRKDSEQRCSSIKWNLITISHYMTTGTEDEIIIFIGEIGRCIADNQWHFHCRLADKSSTKPTQKYVIINIIN